VTFFNIIVPFYNAEPWISRCLKTIKAQDYDNYRVFIVNDCSTDNSNLAIEKEIKDNEKFSLIVKEENGGALSSTFTGIEYAKPNDEDVILVLDGDDWFASKDVLRILDNVYSKNDCLMTYGSYIEYPPQKKGDYVRRGKFSRKLPDSVIAEKSFRAAEWMTSHLRTFKYKLWKNVRREDVLDSSGKIYAMAGDMPVMYPMLEMAEERSHFIEDILYIYNRTNPLNEDKINHRLQLEIEWKVRNKPVYPRLEEM
jgi:glycosyltransferase involved in cell wall biosynthesis